MLLTPANQGLQHTGPPSFKPSSSWRSCAGWLSSCKQKWYMDLSGVLCSKISLCLSTFGMPYNLVILSIWYSSSSFCANISLGAGKNLTFRHPMRLTIPAGLWRLITHIVWCTSGDCSWLVGWQRKKSQAYVASLSSLRYFWQSQPCNFLPFQPLLVQRIRHNRNRRPYELRICAIVTDTLFRMRNTICWTVRMDVLSAFAHSTASLSSPTSVWGKPDSCEDFCEPARYMVGPLFFGWVPTSR